MKKCTILFLMTLFITIMVGAVQGQGTDDGEGTEQPPAENPATGEPATEKPATETPKTEPPATAGPILDDGVKADLKTYLDNLEPAIAAYKAQVDAITGTPDISEVEKVVQTSLDRLKDVTEIAANNIAVNLRQATTVTCIFKAQAKATASIESRVQKLQETYVKAQKTYGATGETTLQALQFINDIRDAISNSIAKTLKDNKDSKNYTKVVAGIRKNLVALNTSLKTMQAAIDKQVLSFQKSTGSTVASTIKSINSDTDSAIKSFKSCR